MHSAIYTGSLRHRRFAPRQHDFSYRLFMMYVDLAELDEVFRGRWLWSVKRPSLAWLRRGDYLSDCAGSTQVSLDHAVRDRVQFETGSRPRGPIRMLTHLRYFGIGMNPVTFYYCFDRDDTQVETIVAEITNTPWKERHAYVLSSRNALLTPSALMAEGWGEGVSVGASQPISALSLALGNCSRRDSTSCIHAVVSHQGRGNEKERHLRFLFKKEFHVSPFMPMQIDYDWRFSMPGERLTVHMQNMQGDAKQFDATLDVHRREITGSSLAQTLASFPLMTAKVIVGIHWQALRLWLKRIPFHSHPSPPDITSSDNEHDSRPSSIS